RGATPVPDPRARARGGRALPRALRRGGARRPSPGRATRRGALLRRISPPRPLTRPCRGARSLYEGAARANNQGEAPTGDPEMNPERMLEMCRKGQWKIDEDLDWSVPPRPMTRDEETAIVQY